MYFGNYLLEAIDVVLTWDIPEEGLSERDFSQAVSAQACLMAGINPDEVIDYGPN